MSQIIKTRSKLCGTEHSPREEENISPTYKSYEPDDCCESDHKITVAKSAIVAVSTRKRSGPRPTVVAPASTIIFNSFSVKSEALRD